MNINNVVEVTGEQVKTVPKLWGKELWLVNTEKYCGKILVVNRGYQCSLHMHPVKDEILFVAKGKIRMEHQDQIYEMTPGHYLHVHPGEYHRFTGLEDSEIFEFSSTHADEDVVRKTESGRVGDTL